MSLFNLRSVFKNTGTKRQKKSKLRLILVARAHADKNTVHCPDQSTLFIFPLLLLASAGGEYFTARACSQGRGRKQKAHVRTRVGTALLDQRQR